jgi:hypothetical protein
LSFPAEWQWMRREIRFSHAKQRKVLKTNMAIEKNNCYILSGIYNEQFIFLLILPKRGYCVFSLWSQCAWMQPCQEWTSCVFLQALVLEIPWGWH